jgi:hypothetical protein
LCYFGREEDFLWFLYHFQALQNVEEESREQKLKLQKDWKRLEVQEKMQQQKLNEAEEEVLRKREQLQVQKDEVGFA